MTGTPCVRAAAACASPARSSSALPRRTRRGPLAAGTPPLAAGGAHLSGCHRAHHSRPRAEQAGQGTPSHEGAGEPAAEQRGGQAGGQKRGGKDVQGAWSAARPRQRHPVLREHDRGPRGQGSAVACLVCSGCRALSAWLGSRWSALPARRGACLRGAACSDCSAGSAWPAVCSSPLLRPRRARPVRRALPATPACPRLRLSAHRCPACPCLSPLPGSSVRAGGAVGKRCHPPLFPPRKGPRPIT